MMHKLSLLTIAATLLLPTFAQAEKAAQGKKPAAAKAAKTSHPKPAKNAKKAAAPKANRKVQKVQKG